MSSVAAAIVKHKLIAVIRVREASAAVEAAIAVAAGGIRLIEIPATVPAFGEAIAQLRSRDDMIVGAASLLDEAQASTALAAGASFLVSPCFVDSVWSLADASDLLYIPGAATPTEVFSLMEKRFSLIKLFPIQHLGGAAYLRAILAAMPTGKFIPTGGIDAENAKEHLDAGAVAVGAGGSILPSQLVEARDWKAITQKASELVASIEA